MNSNFIKCGLVGWTLELIFTSIHTLAQNNDLRLIGQTSLLMFPIYGLGAVFCPLARSLRHFNIMIRGFLYMSLIFLTEYTTGWLLRCFSMCPWDYSGTRFGVNGLIRLDFAPFWFGLGLLFERITGCGRGSICDERCNEKKK